MLYKGSSLQVYAGVIELQIDRKASVRMRATVRREIGQTRTLPTAVLSLLSPILRNTRGRHVSPFPPYTLTLAFHCTGQLTRGIEVNPRQGCLSTTLRYVKMAIIFGTH